MSDFESRLRDTLGERAAAAPDAAGLADGGRRRLRRRRKSWMAVAATAVVAAAVPVGLTVGGGGAPEDQGAPVATQPAEPVADGFKAETWRDLTFEVPEDWGHGGSDWCVFGGSLEGAGPRVARPDTLSFRIFCSPPNGYGAVVQSTAAFDSAYSSGHVWQYQAESVDQQWYPDDAWLGVWIGADWALTVATPDRDLTQRIVDSAHSFTGTDPNGCPPTLGGAEALTSADSALVLCRYDDQDLLAAGGSWTGDKAATRWAALQDAPLAALDVDCAGQASSRIAILGSEGYQATAVPDGCRKGIGIYFSGATREITDEARQVLASIG